jgi:hypothetical protein
MPWTNEARAKAIETKRLRGVFNQFDKAASEGRRIESPLKGRPGLSRPHTEESKAKLREKALASKHRRLLKSTRVYKTKNGEELLLDSSWEEILAKRLDELDIKWIRPDTPIVWTDSRNRHRNYFPDFFLPEFQIYLDPKNSAALKAQSEKVEWLRNNRSDVIFLSSAAECKNFAPVAQRIVAPAF